MACYSSEVCLPISTTSGAAHARGNAQLKRTPLFCRSKPARSTSSRPRARGYGSLVVQSELAPTLRSLGMADAGECGGALPVSVFQASCDAHLQAACNLRARTFYSFIRKTYRLGLNGQIDEVLEDQLVVGSLDLNQTAKLPDEMSGSHPEGNEAQHRRGYLSNVCVAKELQRKGVGTNLIKHTKRLALLQGISDLYTHVAIGNESAERLYEKSGFIKEKEEKASEARLMGRPPRLLLWMDLTKSSKNC